MVIPVNLKIGYESTMLSHRDGALMRENRVNTEGQRYLLINHCRSPRINPPAAAGRPTFYSNFDWLPPAAAVNFDWLDYG